MNQFARQPVINAIQTLIALQTVSTLDNTGVTGTSLDLGVTNKAALAIVETGDIGNLDAASLHLEQSDDNITFVRLTQFNALQQDSRQMIEVHRTKRYLRAVLTIEFEQPDAENPVATSLPLTAFLVL